MSKKPSKISRENKGGGYKVRGSTTRGAEMVVHGRDDRVRDSSTQSASGSDSMPLSGKTGAVQRPTKPCKANSPETGLRVITKADTGEPEFAVLPWKDWTALCDRLEDLEDVAIAEGVKADLADGRDELVPIEVVDRLIKGESPIRVWRTFRDKTQGQLAAETGLDQGYISELESGRKSNPTASALRALAEALEVTIDDLVA